MDRPPSASSSSLPTTVLTLPGQSVEPVLRGPAINFLRTGLEEKAALLVECQGRNIEMRGHSADYLHRLCDAEVQMSQLRLQTDQLKAELRARDAKLEEQNAELQLWASRNRELFAKADEQASQIGVLDGLVTHLHYQKRELNKKNNGDLDQKIEELQDIIKQLRYYTEAHPPPSPPLQNDDLSDDELIDHRINGFFRNYADCKMSAHKEEAGLYLFGNPINRTVAMKVVSGQVLARVDGGWHDVWTWLSNSLVEVERDNHEIEKEGHSRSTAFTKSLSATASCHPVNGIH